MTPGADYSKSAIDKSGDLMDHRPNGGETERSIGVVGFEQRRH